MTLDNLGNVGEIVGAIAVVASLIYLALQIRQNTSALRSAAYRDATASAAEVNALLANNSDLATLFARGTLDFDRLNPIEKMQVGAVLGTLCGMYQELSYQYSQGHLDPDFWLGFESGLTALFQLPGVREWWPDRARLFSSDFQLLVSRVTSPPAV